MHWIEPEFGVMRAVHDLHVSDSFIYLAVHIRYRGEYKHRVGVSAE